MTFRPVLNIVKSGDNFVEITDDLAGSLFNIFAIHNKYNIISTDVTDKTAVRLSIFYGIEDKSAEHLQDFIPTAESVTVIVRFKEVEVGISKSKLITCIQPFLYLLCDLNITRQPCQRIYFDRPLRPLYGQFNP